MRETIPSITDTCSSPSGYEYNHDYGGQDRSLPRGRRIPREENDDSGRRPGVGRQRVERQALEARTYRLFPHRQFGLQLLQGRRLVQSYRAGRH